MTQALHLRQHFVIVALFLLAMSPVRSQSISPIGAWMSHGRWEAAPKEVNRNLRATGAQVIYFEKDGTFTLWSGTLYSERHQSPTISEGDAETSYSGDWTELPSGPKVKMRKVYADVPRVGETIPSQEETVVAQQRTDRILFKSIWFTRRPSLDGQMLKYALGAKQRHGK